MRQRAELLRLECLSKKKWQLLMVTVWKIPSLNIWTYPVLAKLFPEDEAAIGW